MNTYKPGHSNNTICEWHNPHISFLDTFLYIGSYMWAISILYIRSNSTHLKALVITVIHGNMPHVSGGNTQSDGLYLQRIPPLTMQNTFILSYLFLKASCFRKATFESPLIASYSPFSVCTKVTQISLTTSTTFHWICWNTLWHLLVHKTYTIIELIVSQTTPFWTELISMHGDTSSTYQPLLYNAKLTFSFS